MLFKSTMGNPKIKVPNLWDLSFRLFKAPGLNQKLLKSPNFLDFKGHNKRFLDRHNMLRSIRSWQIRKSWF